MLELKLRAFCMSVLPHTATPHTKHVLKGAGQEGAVRLPLLALGGQLSATGAGRLALAGSASPEAATSG